MNTTSAITWDPLGSWDDLEIEGIAATQTNYKTPTKF